MKFIAEIEDGLVAYNENEPISAEWDYSGPEPALKIIWKEIDPDVLAALGDAIHNMRSALDLMASELARINGKSDRNIYFPFAGSEEEFPAAVKRKNFHLAGDDAVALVTQFAPYKGGNVMLRAVHDLDIEDKHTAILVTQRTTKNLRLTYQRNIGTKPPVAIAGATITHHFLQEPLAGQPLIETLKALVELVEDILKAFEVLVGQRS